MTASAATIEDALTEVGYTECPRDPAGQCLFTGHGGEGDNHTKFAAEAGLANGVFWCAVFTTAILKRNGVPIAPGAGTTSTRDNKAAWIRAGQWVEPPDIQAGDIVFFHTSDRNGKAHSIPSHTGIAMGQPKNGRLPSVEGNTSSDNAGDQENGGGVFRKNRRLTVVIGAGRPNYDQAAGDEFLPALSDDEKHDLLTAALETRNIVANLQAVADRDINALGSKIADVLAAVKADADHGSGPGDVDPEKAAEATAKAILEELGK